MRLRAPTAAGAAPALVACGGPPEGVCEDMIDDYIAAAASIGCVMKCDSDDLPVALQAGPTRRRAPDITTHPVATDRAETLPGGGVKLTTGACA